MKRLAACMIVGLMGAIASGQTTTNNPPQSGKPAGEQPPSKRESAVTPRGSATKLLNTRIAQIEFDQLPLSDVFARLGEIADTNVVVRWSRLEDAGIERDKPISISTRNLRFSQILWLVISEAAAPDAELAYRADRDLILISTVDDIGRVMVTRVYDIQDLVAPKLSRPGLTIGRIRDVPIGNTVTVAGGAVAVRPIIGRFGTGTFLQGEPTRRNGSDEYDADRERLLEQLIDLITTTIEPDSWAAAGGTGTITPYKGTLVVRNTLLVHQRIWGDQRIWDVLLKSGAP